MKDRFFKITGLILILAVLINTIGCSSGPGAKNSASNKAKTSEVKKNKENTATVEIKQNSKQTEVPSASSQQNTAAPSSQTSSTPAAATTANGAAKQQSASTNVNSSTSASGQPSQSTTTAAASPSTQQTVKPAPATPSPNQAQAQTVKMSIIGPKDKGTIINGKTINIKTGESVLDVLIDAIGKNNIDYSGSGATAYVKGIDNIYEFDYGPKSGWTVSQNGTRLTRSAGAIQVKAGDTIEWQYTEDYTVSN